MKRWLILLLVAVALFGAAVGGAMMWLRSQLAASGPALGPANIVIAKGTSSAQIAVELRSAGVIERSWLFPLAVHFSGRQPLKAGEYAFAAHASLASVIDMMRRGQTVVHRFTVAEGATVFQALAQLRQAEAMTGNPGTPPEEGSLMPQTYFYSYGDSREGLVLRMTRAMNDALDETWDHRAPGLPLANKMEALILASIVERETAISEERAHVAAVFLNRLKGHIKLQSDPTVVYGLSNGEGSLVRPLSHDDLAVKNPFNTYVVDGLPAGPICNPGRASLEAVLHPADSDDLYFVADGSGGHVFARTLEEHNRNVAQLRRIERGEVAAPAEKKVKSAR